MTHQNFKDFDIESSFHKEEYVNNFAIQKIAEPPKASSPQPRFKVIIFFH